MHLTKKSIAEIPAPIEGFSLTVDDTLKGFYVLTYPSGTKSFIIRYTKGKSRKKFVLGDATVILPKDARKRAAALFADIRVGKYPEEKRKSEREKQSEPTPEPTLCFSTDGLTHGEIRMIKSNIEAWIDRLKRKHKKKAQKKP
jgi:hypothetical protein